MNRWVWFGLPLMLLAAAWVPSASADVEGDCTVIIADQDLAVHSATDPEGALHIDNASTTVTYRLLLPPETVAYKVVLDLGVASRTVVSERIGPDPRPLNVTGNFSLQEYGWIGSGLYRVHAEAQAQDGSKTCAAEALVRFQPGRVATATMVIAGFAVAGGLAGVTATVVEALRETKEKLDAVKDFKRHMQVALQTLQKK